MLGPAVHVRYQQERAVWRTWMDVVVRIDGAGARAAASMREDLTRLDRWVPLVKIRTVNEVIASSVADRRFNLSLLGAFGQLRPRAARDARGPCDRAQD